MSNVILLTHEVSNLGRFNINLHGVAAEFYKLALKDGLIDYLKRLDHLGFIAKAHPGNHHKRWDYVCLQLFLFQKLKHSNFNTGLNSANKIGAIEVSNLELVQLFVLVANVGHLEGTVSGEKALFDFLVQNESKKLEFLKSINQYQSFSGIAKKIFDDNDFYKIKYLIALNYLLSKQANENIISAIEHFLMSYVVGNEKTEKLLNLFHRVRRICFVYLDSHHCHTPLQLNISKILINIFNYDELFNPVEHDYDKILDASETVLTKQIYLSPLSSQTFKTNYDAFILYLRKYIDGGKKVNYNNFLISFLKGRREKFELLFPNQEQYLPLQFYLSKDALKIFDTPYNHDFESFVKKLFDEEKSIEKTLKNLLPKGEYKMTVQYDIRKTLLFFTFIVPKSLNQNHFKIFINNFCQAVNRILQIIAVPSSENIPQNFIDELIKGVRNDIIRRLFLFILKLLFETNNRLNLYIKFQYKQVQNKINKNTYLNKLYEANFAKNQQEFERQIKHLLELNLPEDIENNIRLIRSVANENNVFKTGGSCYYTVLPVEVEEKIFNPAELDKLGNSEVKNIITDIDAMLLVVNNTSIQLFLLEGKKIMKNFQSECTKDLLKIAGLSKFSKLFLTPKIIHETYPSTKGGYLSFRS